MKRATLFLLVGYPGSGKTTTSQVIHDLTGAAHIWADYERRAMFGEPTHSAAESRTLYDHLNRSTEILLSEHQNIIFDTNFNFRKDRDLLRGLAAKYNADTKLVWIKVGKKIARARALSKGHAEANSYMDTMSAKDFDRITGNLEPPEKDENPYILDGTMISRVYVARILRLPMHAQRKSVELIKARIHHRSPAKP